ncbi:MAG TPA: hypothetical protein VNL91_01125 [Thermoanaerobaculia bacterium]|nr:hypothetical protein [Thermoanaerobaculia bacterium]
MLPTRPFFAAASVLAVVSAGFFWRQNFAGQIGGAMSVAKILWLDYAILSWFVVPAFLMRSPDLDARWRRLFAVHLINFGTRAVIELWLLYVTVSWSPVYGIVHDVFSILLITFLSGAPAQKLALHHSWTLRLTLGCEIVFASLFHSVTAGEHALWFAADEPRFRLINMLTWIVNVIAYIDLAWIVTRGRPLDAAPELQRA